MKQYLGLFRNRNFLLHWLAGAVSNVGDFFNSLALLKILSEDPEHLGMYMALIMVAKMAPGILLGTAAGVMADRLPRRAIMITTNLLRAVLVLGLVLVEQPSAIITLVFLSAIVSVFYHPASSAMLPNLVKKEELVTAGSLNVMTQRLAMLLGNGIGAVVLGMVGAHNVFYIDAASFVVSALFLMAMVLPVSAVAAPSGTEARQGLWQKFTGDLNEALSFLRTNPPVRRLIMTLGLANMSDSAFNVLMVTFVTVGLGIAAQHMGYLIALFGAVSAIGALGIGALGRRVHWRHLIAVGAIYGWMTMMVALAMESPVPSVTFLLMLGLGSGAVNVGLQAAIGELIPDHVRGRIFGAWGVITNLIFVVGSLVAGALSDLIGPTLTLMGFTTFLLVAGIYAFFAFRRLPEASSEPATARVAGD